VNRDSDDNQSDDPNGDVFKKRNLVCTNDIGLVTLDGREKALVFACLDVLVTIQGSLKHGIGRVAFGTLFHCIFLGLDIMGDHQVLFKLAVTIDTADTSEMEFLVGKPFMNVAKIVKFGIG